MEIYGVKDEETSGTILNIDEPGLIPAADIRVFGIGGGGTNLTNHMIDAGLQDVKFIAVNTDAQDLLCKSKAKIKVSIGRKLTNGRGAGGKPETGEKAANEDREHLLEYVRGADMVFITATMGGGTGTGAAPVIASIAREEGALTVAVVTKPFAYEGPRKMELAEKGIAKLREAVDTLIVIPNENVFRVVTRNIKATEAYLKANDILRFGVQGISDIITKKGFVNTDFADVANTMRDQGDALFGIGTAAGENRAIQAADAAIKNPLFENTSIVGATHLLVNISASEELEFGEIEEALNRVRADAAPEVDLIHGVTIDSSQGEKIQVIVIATGFTGERAPVPKTEGADSAAAKPAKKQEWLNIDDWEQTVNRSGKQPGYLGPRNGAIPEDIDIPTFIREKISTHDKERKYVVMGETSGNAGALGMPSQPARSL